MKKIAFILIMVFAVSIAYSQKMNYQSAVSSYNKGYLDKAKKYIDTCAVNPETKEWAKTWVYRGNIYYAILISTEDKYKKLDSNALQKAYDSYQKAVELDTKKEYWESTDMDLNVQFKLYLIGEQYYNKGVEFYQDKKYDDAMASFDKTASINGIFGLTDTSATYNAALCAEYGNKPEKAKEYYKKLIKAEYHQPLIFSSLANIYINDKDTAQALTTIKKGREKYPENQDLATSEANIYIASGKIKEAKEILELLITKDPTNPVLYYNVGVVYDNSATDASQTAEARETFFNESVTAYKKAIELKTDYFDAIYNLGALYFNEGVRVFQEADKLTDMTLYDTYKKKFDLMWTEALPYLERAYELNKTDENTIISLKQLYSRTNQLDKLKALNEGSK